MSKYKKGDKFLIEIAERHSHYTDDGKEYNLYRIKGFNSLVFDDYGLDRLSVFKNYEDRGKTLHILIDNYLKYEKALDKACQILEDNVYDLVIEKDGVFKKAIEDEELSKFNDEDFNVEYLSENGIYKGNFKRWLLKDE